MDTYIVKFFYIVIILLSNWSSKLFATKFSPSLGIINNYAIIQCQEKINSGLFTNTNRKLNVGLEILQQFNFYSNLFINTGFRFNHYKLITLGNNTVPLLNDYPTPFNWERSYTIISIPIQLGYEHRFMSNKKLKIFAGYSIGFASLTSAQNRINSLNPKSPNFNDTIKQNMVQANFDSNHLIQTIEVGAHFYPIKRIPNFFIGINANAQLGYSFDMTHQASIKIPSQNIDALYDMNNKSKINSIGVVLGYKFL